MDEPTSQSAQTAPISNQLKVYGSENNLLACHHNVKNVAWHANGSVSYTDANGGLHHYGGNIAAVYHDYSLYRKNPTHKFQDFPTASDILGEEQI